MKTLHAVALTNPVLPGSTPEDLPLHRLEVWGVRDTSPEGSDGTECEQVDQYSSEPPDFWSVYDHNWDDPRVIDCTVIDDYQTRDEALQAAAALSTARNLPAYDFTHEGFR